MSKENYFGIEKKRYETKRISEEIDVLYRFIIWSLIDTLKEQMELDYLQVFEFVTECEHKSLTPQDYELKLVHRQEQPYYKKEYSIPVKSVIDAKIYVIDDGEQVTMLFAEEY